VSSQTDDLKIMEFIKKLGGYASGNLLTLIAGLLSFPIFTRMLSTSDYGVMSLINLTSSLCITFCKGGLQHALIREWDDNKEHERIIVSTALFGSAIITGVILFILGSITIFITYYSNSWMYAIYFCIICGLTTTEVIKSIFYNKIRATQDTLWYNIITVFSKYGQITFAVLFMILYSNTAVGLFSGFIVISITIVILLFYRNRKHISLAAFDCHKFRTMLAFGFPLIFYELNNMLLTFVDRYFIGIFQGVATVGAYSAAYNMTFYIQNLLVSSVSLTLYPMVVEKLKKENSDAYRQFMRESLLWFCLVSSAVVLGFAALGKDVFLLSATVKYAEATVVITPVICGSFFYGVFIVSSSELFVQNNTKAMALIMTIAALINLALDILLIPRMKLLGAAYATLIPEIFLAVVGLWKMGVMKDKELLVRIIHYCVPGIIMYTALVFFGGRTAWSSIMIRVFIGITLWICTVLLTNKLVRNQLILWINLRKIN
jgi:O-antigen/teichoic acid export membrane protein